MPRRTWDVEDDRKLRSALGSTATFASDGYHRMWAVPRNGGTTGIESNVGIPLSLAIYGLDDSSSEQCWFDFIKPPHWKRGVLLVRWHFIGTTNTGALTVYVETRVRGWGFQPGSQLAPDYWVVAEAFDMPDSGGSTARTTYEPTGWGDSKVDMDEREMISVRLERQGANGADTMVGDLRVAGVELIFNPDARP